MTTVDQKFDDLLEESVERYEKFVKLELAANSGAVNRNCLIMEALRSLDGVDETKVPPKELARYSFVMGFAMAQAIANLKYGS